MQVVLSVTVMLMDLPVAIVTVSVAIMQVVPSVVCTTVSVVKCRLLSSNNVLFLSLTLIFHKIDKKTFKGILSGLHFTTFLNILPKLRYFRVEII